MSNKIRVFAGTHTVDVDGNDIIVTREVSRRRKGKSDYHKRKITQHNNTRGNRMKVSAGVARTFGTGRLYFGSKK